MVCVVYVLALQEDCGPLWVGSGRAITLMQYWKVLLTMTQTISITETIIICTCVISFVPKYYCVL